MTSKLCFKKLCMGSTNGHISCCQFCNNFPDSNNGWIKFEFASKKRWIITISGKNHIKWYTVVMKGEKEMGVKLEINQQRCDSNVITNSVLPVHFWCRIFSYQVNINRFTGNIWSPKFILTSNKSGFRPAHLQIWQIW